MHATFVQKVILTIVAGFFAACLVWFYRNIIEKGNEEINVNWRNNTGQSASPTPR